MSGLIPDPPPGDPADWGPRVRAYMATGVYGGCVMCPDGGYEWWDLTAANLPPVVDRTGTLTDQVALHPRCVATLLAYWASLSDPSDLGAGDSPEAPDSAPGAEVPPSDDPFRRERRPARARVGAYARRGEA